MSEQLRHKMKEFAVTPPPAAWDTIAARLNDDTHYFTVAAKMNRFEAAPPPLAWENITSALDDNEKKDTPIRYGRTWLRIAAAAVVLTCIISSLFLFNKNNSVDNTVVKNIPAPNIKQAPAAVTNQEKVITTNRDSNEVTIAKNEGDNALPVKNNRSYTSASQNEGIVQYAMVNDIPVHYSTPISEVKAPPILDRNGNPIMDIDVLMVNSNYLVVAGPNGQLTRISSKFANVIRFINAGNDDTEEYLDKVIKESGIWKTRFKEWRTKISQSAYIPASVNFLDIIELKDLLQEK